MFTFPLYPIVDGRCGCGNPECKNAGKHPAEYGWPKLPLREPPLTPTHDRGVGIATGARSGVFVVDLDVKNGIDGVANFAALGDVPETYSVATPTGGFHLYFRHPGFPVRNSGPKTNPIAPGVDIRGDGGYVVAPGSPHRNGGTYSVAADLPIAEAPSWLLQWPGLRRADAELAAPVTDVEERFGHVPREWRVAGAKAWLERQSPAIEGQGGDGHTFTTLTRAVHDWCLTDADMIADAFVEWNARCEPPWEGSKWAHKVDSALHHSTVQWNTAIDMKYAESRIASGSTPTSASVSNSGPTSRLTASERALRMHGRDVTRLQTGFATIDLATRGGIMRRKLVVIGGAPGAGKTAMLVRFAYTWLEQGVHVGILASDEDADGLLIRLGQLHGLSRDALERGDPVATRALADWCASVPLLLVDGDEDERHGTIEALSRDLRARAGDTASVMLVDSIQTARSDVDAPKGADIRAKIDGIVRALKRCAKVDGHIVVVSSELSRAAYRNKDQAENVNALAAFKESGSIEYGVTLAVVLASRQGTSEIVDAAIVKNRLGHAKPEFMLRLDHDRADVRETTTQDAKAVDPLFDLKCKIKDEVQKAHGVPLAKRQIAARVGGRTKTAFKVIGDLIDANVLHEERQGIRLPLPGDPGYELV